ncbi:sulfotransferase family protein [Oceanithermus sp.]
MKKPNFFILGAPKCGTTSLAAWLGEHPNVFISPIKEPNFFNSDLNKHVISDWHQYMKLYNGATEKHTAIGEASTTYLYSRVAVSNIEQNFPGSRYIAMIRNPVEMAYSLHEQEVFAGHENILDFERAWEMSPERRHGQNVSPTCSEPTWLDYQRVCALGEQLERLYSSVPKERIHVVVLDDLKKDPRTEYLKVLDFLGLPDDGRGLFTTYNPSKGVRSLIVSRTISMAEKYAKIAKHRLGISHIPTGILTYIKNLNKNERPRPRLSNKTRQKLILYYKYDINKLSTLLNRDFSNWMEL